MAGQPRLSVRTDVLTQLQMPAHTRRRRLLGVVFFALLCDYLLLTVVVPVVPALLLALPDGGAGAQQQMVAVLFSSKALVQLLCNPVCGYLVARLGPRLPLLSGLAVLTASTLCFALSTNYAQLLVARALQGAASASLMTAGMSALMGAYSTTTDRSEACGIAMGGVGVGVTLGPTIGALAFVETPVGHALPFLLLATAVAGLFVFALVYTGEGSLEIRPRSDSVDHPLVKSRSSSEAPRGPPHMLMVFMDSTIASVLLCLVAANSVIAALEPTIPLLLTGRVSGSELALPEWSTGLVFMCATVTYGVCSPIVGWLLGRTERSTDGWCQCGSTVFLMVGMGLVSAALPLIATGMNMAGLWRCIAGLAAVGMGMACVDSAALPLLAATVEAQYGSNAFGAVFALSDMALSLGYLLGPPASAALQRLFADDNTDSSHSSGEYSIAAQRLFSKGLVQAWAAYGWLLLSASALAMICLRCSQQHRRRQSTSTTVAGGSVDQAVTTADTYTANGAVAEESPLGLMHAYRGSVRMGTFRSSSACSSSASFTSARSRFASREELEQQNEQEILQGNDALRLV